MNTDNKTKDTKKPRSRQYPAAPLPELVPLLKDISNAVGYGMTSRDNLATALGYSSVNGTSSPKIAAFVHFGMMETVGRSTYRLSESAKRLILPRDDKDYYQALQEAAKTPKLYQELFDRFAGGSLPSLLPNILARDFGILPQQSQNVADDFKLSVEFAGLLKNGVLSITPNVEEEPAGTSTSEDTEFRPRPPSAERQFSEEKSSAILNSYTIPLTKGRVGVLQLPAPLADSDLKRIKAWIDIMQEVLTEDDSPEFSAN